MEEELNNDDRKYLVALDLDDTLYKEQDFIFSGYHYIDAFLKERKGVTGSFEILKEGYHKDDKIFETLLAKQNITNITWEELLKLYWAHMPDIHLDNATKRILDFLKESGVRLALITDGYSTTQRNKIKALGIDKYFDPEDIIISEEFGSEKTVLNNFKYFNDKYLDIDKFFYIGDNPIKDFFWPNRLGWTTICLQADERNIFPQRLNGDRTHMPNIVVDNLFDILESIEF